MHTIILICINRKDVKEIVFICHTNIARKVCVQNPE